MKLEKCLSGGEKGRSVQCIFLVAALLTDMSRNKYIFSEEPRGTCGGICVKGA